MTLRAELEPKIEIAEKIFPQVIELITLYDDGYDNSDRHKVETAISKINALTNKNIQEDDLLEYWGAESREELAFKLSIPDPIKVDNISRDELLEIINRIESFEDKGISDKLLELGIPLSYILAYGYYLPLLERNFSHPEPGELFNQKNVNGKFIKLTVDEIANKILAHKPIEL